MNGFIESFGSGSHERVLVDSVYAMRNQEYQGVANTYIIVTDAQEPERRHKQVAAECEKE